MDTHIQIRWNSLRKLDNLGANKDYNERHLLRFIYTHFSQHFRDDFVLYLNQASKATTEVS